MVLGTRTFLHVPPPLPHTAHSPTGESQALPLEVCSLWDRLGAATRCCPSRTPGRRRDSHSTDESSEGRGGGERGVWGLVQGHSPGNSGLETLDPKLSTLSTAACMGGDRRVFVHALEERHTLGAGAVSGLALPPSMLTTPEALGPTPLWVYSQES